MEKIEKILTKVLDEDFVLEKKNIVIGLNTFYREGNFIDLSEVVIRKDQKKISVGFGEEWKEYKNILNEYKEEFNNYFDIVPERLLSEEVIVADLGCGNGRWSVEYLRRNQEAFLIVVDISDAIYVAQKNLESFSERVLLIKSDITKLPFKENCLDFFFSLGVIHHIPGDLYKNLEKVSLLSNEHLIYLYYALDNRGLLFKALFKLVNLVRILLSLITINFLKVLISKLIMLLVYLPLIFLSKFIKSLGFNSKNIPLNYYAQEFSLNRIEQDVYDRFFTHIEKRVYKKELQEFYKNNNAKVIFSAKEPFWHFFIKKNAKQH